VPAPPNTPCRTHSTATAEHRFAPTPASIREARLAVRGALSEAGFRGDIEVALLVASEVVTNAVRHAATPIRVSVVASSDGALIRVVDYDPEHLPARPGHAGPQAAGGRGLRIVDRLARAWGVDASSMSKTVWFTVA
jgi:anti-sigma regulatory factor (Ser/Thr protein kinase)